MQDNLSSLISSVHADGWLVCSLAQNMLGKWYAAVVLRRPKCEPIFAHAPKGHDYDSAEDALCAAMAERKNPTTRFPEPKNYGKRITGEQLLDMFK